MVYAHAMHDVITSVEQVTPAWLTNVLREGGHLAAEQVQTVTVTGIHAEQVHSISYFLALDYGPSAHSGLPTRLFLKLPRPGIAPTVAAAIGEREVGMYRMFAAHQHALPIIQCYSAAYAPTAQTYHLLLDDLSATHNQPAWHLEIAEQYMTQTIDCLAQFHAYWWEHASLHDLHGFLPRQEDGTAEIVRLQHAWPTFLNTLGDHLTCADRYLYEQTLAALPQVWAARTVQPGQTLVHGDAHFWNFLYPLDPHMHRTRMLDWQCVHTGMGVEDVAYTIILRYPHRTAANEHALVQRYHHQLGVHGVTNYDWSQCWTAYRCAAVEHLLTPLQYWLGGLPDTFWHPFVSRTLVATHELSGAELVAAL